MMEDILPDNEFDKTDDFITILNDLRVKEGDALVQEFIKILKNRIPTDIEHLKHARRTENLQELKQKAHFLSTTLITLKFQQGLSLAKRIENAIDTNNQATALSLTDAFTDYLKRVLKEIK